MNSGRTLSKVQRGHNTLRAPKLRVLNLEFTFWGIGPSNAKLTLRAKKIFSSWPETWKVTWLALGVSTASGAPAF